MKKDRKEKKMEIIKRKKRAKILTLKSQTKLKT